MSDKELKVAEPIALGALRGAYGLKGWVRVQPFQSGDALLDNKEWVIMQKDGTHSPVTVEQCKVHGGALIAKFANIQTPEEADALRGAVGLPREAFPETEEGEFYWVDLIGCKVVNQKGEELGIVEAMDTNGVQDILDVRGNGHRYLIPFVDNYLVKVDVSAETIEVDWEKDWF